MHDFCVVYDDFACCILYTYINSGFLARGGMSKINIWRGVLASLWLLSHVYPGIILVLYAMNITYRSLLAFMMTL